MGAINFLPFHGLWKNGQVTLPNGATMSYPAPNSVVGYGEELGDAWIFKRPGWSAPPRSPAEAAADAAAGRQWLPYAIASSTRKALGDQTLYPKWLYIDPAGKTWLVFAAYLGLSGARLLARVTFKRFGLFDGKSHPSVTIETTCETDAGTSSNLKATIAHSSNGAKAIVGRFHSQNLYWGSGTIWPDTFWQLDISGVGDETLPNFGFSISLTLLVGHENGLYTNTTIVDEIASPVYLTQSVEKVSVGPNDCTITSTWSGGRRYQGTAILTSQQTVKLWAAFDGNDVLQWLESHYNWTGTTLEYGDAIIDDPNGFLAQSGGIPEDFAYWHQVDVVEQQSSASNTITYGGVTIFSCSRSRPPDVQTTVRATSQLNTPSHWLGDPTPDGLGLSYGSHTFTRSDGYPANHTETTTVGLSAQYTPTWGIGYPFAFSETVDGKRRVTQCVRYSSTVIGLIELDTPLSPEFAISPVTRQRLVGAWAPDGAYSAIDAVAPLAIPVAARWTGSAWSGQFASWHPVTGQLAVDSVPICWV